MMSLLACRFPKMLMQLTHAERHADALLREQFAGRTDGGSLFLEASRSQRNIGRDHDIELFNVLRDPVIGGVGTCGDRDVMEMRMGGWPDAAIADHEHFERVAAGDTLDFALYRTGIRIDENLQQARRLFA